MPDPLASAPSEFFAGDTVKWYQAAPDTPAADGWALTVALSGASALEVTATNDSGTFLVTLPATETDALEPGTYRWVARASLAGDVYTVASGTMTVRQSPAIAGAGSQPWAEKHLAAIEAVLAGRITADVESYQIAGRQLVKIPVADLLKMRAQFAAEVRRRRNGGRIGAPLLVEFTRTGMA